MELASLHVLDKIRTIDTSRHEKASNVTGKLKKKFWNKQSKAKQKTKQNLSKLTLVSNLINCPHVRSRCLARVIIVIVKNNKWSIIGPVRVVVGPALNTVM